VPRASSPQPHVRLSLRKNGAIGVEFKYDRVLVQSVRGLPNRRWVPGDKVWEVHPDYLQDVMRLFGISDDELPAEVRALAERAPAERVARVELGPIESRLIGEGLPTRDIDVETSFAVPGAEFSPRFKKGWWDGKRHLYSAKTGKFPTGLWPRIAAALEKRGIRWEVVGGVGGVDEVDEVNAVDAVDEADQGRSPNRAQSTQPPTSLRDYQVEALEAALSRRRGVIQIATGGGKTLLAAHLIARLDRPTWFFVHTRDLLHQTAAVFERELAEPIGLLGDGRIEPARVTVATIQSAARLFKITPEGGRGALDPESDEKPAAEKATRLGARREALAAELKAARLVIFDECHHLPADTAYKIARESTAADHRIGLSATPWRDDGLDLLLEAALGPRLAHVSCSDLIDRGFLVRPAIQMEAAPGKTLGFGAGPYPEIYRRAIVENPQRNRVIATRARQWAEQGRSVLILVTQVAHGRILAEMLPEARLAHGQIDSATRREWIVDLERKLHPILIATTLADEGLDVPSLDSLILAGGGRSTGRAYQRIGRALRPAPGKTTAHVLDFFDRSAHLAMHSRARLDLYRGEPAFDVAAHGFDL
jgi:superfamily II DNA or RNA helicase